MLLLFLWLLFLRMKIMKNKALLVSMKTSGFRNSEIEWVSNRAKKLSITPSALLSELSAVFLKLILSHSLVVIIFVLTIVLNYQDMEEPELISLIFTCAVAFLIITMFGPLIISFKSFRMLRKEKL